MFRKEISIMFILQEILSPLQKEFSACKLGSARSDWFTHIILSCIIPFTHSISSNLLRSLTHLFGLDITQRRFYTFMASSKLPWENLWIALWKLIPNPLTDGRLLLVLDDFINTKVGKKVFGCSHVFDHAAKTNQSKYPWAQCVTSTGLLKKIKGRWACLPLAHRFYLPVKEIEAQKANMKVRGKSQEFRTKLEQAVDMFTMLAAHFTKAPILAVCDSWFGNNGLFKPARIALGDTFHLLSRLRANIMLYDMPSERSSGQLGRNKKYGKRLGSTAELASILKDAAETLPVFLYGKTRDVKVSSTIVMLKTLKCPIRVVFVYRRVSWVALFSTDLSLSVEQMIEFYGARWKIESGFKEIKQDIGASRSQMRNSQSVMNHLNFCMMAATVTWIYAIHLENAPTRRHMIRGRSSFAFSDIRYIITKQVLDHDFNTFCSNIAKPAKNLTVESLMRMVA